LANLFLIQAQCLQTEQCFYTVASSWFCLWRGLSLEQAWIIFEFADFLSC